MSDVAVDLWGCLLVDAGQRVPAHILAGHHPFVVVFAKHSADEADEAFPPGKIPTTRVLRLISLFRRSSGLEIRRQCSVGNSM